MITLEKLKDKHLGQLGSQKRDQYEQELGIELLAEHIKLLRKERNLTQEELGVLIGVQRAQISKLENNTNNVQNPDICTHLFQCNGNHLSGAKVTTPKFYKELMA